MRSRPPYFFGQVMPIQPLAPMRWLNALLCESPWPARLRIEGSGRDFLGQEGAHFLAQLVAFGRQADLVEGEYSRS